MARRERIEPSPRAAFANAMGGHFGATAAVQAHLYPIVGPFEFPQNDWATLVICYGRVNLAIPQVSKATEG